MKQLFYFLVLSVSCTTTTPNAGETINLSVTSKSSQSSECEIAAELNLSGDKSKPLVLFFHGSGPINRDGHVGGINIYKNIAKSLNHLEYSTLRWDKRTSIPECAKNIINNKELSPEVFLIDGKNVLDFVRNKYSNRFDKIVVFGHSQGVTLVLNSNGRLGKIDGVILAAGAGKYSIDQLLLKQLETLRSEKGVPTKEKIEEVRAGLANIINKQWPDDKMFMGAYPHFWRKWREMDQRNAILISEINVPVLLLQGTMDKNITLEDFEVLKSNIQPNSTAVLIDNVDHLLSKDNKTVSFAVLQEISRWLKQLDTD